MWFLYLSADSVCKSLFDIRSVFNSRQSADKQVYVTGFSTVSFSASFPQILRSLQRSSLQIQPSIRPNVWCVSFQSFSRSWYSDLDYGWYRLHEMELGLTAGVTGRLGMYTPPRNLIQLLVYPEIRVALFSNLYFLQDLLHYDCSFFMQFHLIFKEIMNISNS
jgi:hypothetical protein